MKSKLLNFKNTNIVNILNKNKLILLLILLFTVGLICGVISCDKSSLIRISTQKYLSNYMDIRNNGSFGEVFGNSILPILCFLLVQFLFGTSIFGIIFSPFLIFVYSFFYGDFIALMYNIYGIKGVAYNAVFIIPSKIFATVAIFIAAIFSIKFSFSLAQLTLPHNPQVNMFENFKLYCKNYTFIFPLVLFSSFIDYILWLSFYSSFNI